MTQQHGPEALCQRTACSSLVGPHKAGRHLDPRDDLYDGPDLTLSVLPLAVRESARKIVREAPALMPEVIDMARHIEFLRDQLAAARVDGDRREHAAQLRSQDCKQHGKDIKKLDRQIHAMDQAQRRTEAARRALLGLLEAVQDLVDNHQQGHTAETLMSRLAQVVKKTGAAHDRAWKQ